MSDQGVHFLNFVIEELTSRRKMLHKKYTPYHPQANGQAKSTNKVLVRILKKIVEKVDLIGIQKWIQHCSHLAELVKLQQDCLHLDWVMELKLQCQWSI